MRLRKRGHSGSSPRDSTLMFITHPPRNTTYSSQFDIYFKMLLWDSSSSLNHQNFTLLLLSQHFCLPPPQIVKHAVYSYTLFSLSSSSSSSSSPSLLSQSPLHHCSLGVLYLASAVCLCLGFTYGFSYIPFYVCLYSSQEVRYHVI
jgi:hypothetical protein